MKIKVSIWHCYGHISKTIDYIIIYIAHPVHKTINILPHKGIKII